MLDCSSSRDLGLSIFLLYAIPESLVEVPLKIIYHCTDTILSTVIVFGTYFTQNICRFFHFFNLITCNFIENGLIFAQKIDVFAYIAHYFMKKYYLCPQLTNSVNMKRIWNTFCEEISKNKGVKEITFEKEIVKSFLQALYAL